jgi:hypothetical protein
MKSDIHWDSPAQVMNLMVKCPTTGKDADTGHSLDAETLKTARFENRAFECGQCGEMHLWEKADLVQYNP